MEIKVLGSGCANCKALEARTVEALDSLGLQAPIHKVTDFPSIVAYDVMSTPALVIDERVVVTGRVPSVNELRNLLAGVQS
ncbi:MAG: thioredoxin family protein [Acidimicrobiia bacterium]